MTVLSALRCPEGAVLATDSRETLGSSEGGRIAKNVTKLYQPRTGFLVAWAGFENVAQAFALEMERMDGLSPSQDRLEIKKTLEGVIFRIREAGETDYAEWFVAWWSEPDDMAVALKLFSARPGKWVETWEFAGDAMPCTIAHIVSEAIRFVPRPTLTLEQAKLMALKVLRDTIHIGVESIGGEAQIASVSRTCVEIVTGTMLRGLHDALDVWEAQAAELLPGAATVPGASETPDRGIKLPSPLPSAPSIVAQPKQTP